TRSVKINRQGKQWENQKYEIAINAEGDQAGNVKEEAAKDHKRQHARSKHRHRHNRHPRHERRVSFGVLNGMTGLMRSDAERCDRRRVEYVARGATVLAPRS